MDIFSILIIGFIVLFGVVGYIRGFFNIFLGILKSLSSFLISFFLAKPFGMLLYNFGLGKVITSDIESTLTSGNEFFNVVLTQENKTQVIKDALNELNIPEFLHDIVSGIGNNLIGELDGHTIGYYISASVANICCIAIGFIILLIFSSAIIILLRKFLNGFAKIGIVGLVNNILGALVNIAFTIFIISFVFWGIATLTTFMPSFNEIVNDWFYLESDRMTLAKWLYQNNLIIKLFELFVK